MEKILLIFGLHYIADFSLQGDFLEKMKGIKIYFLFAHSMIYATIISIGLLYFNMFFVWKFILLLLSHMLIDNWKNKQSKNEDGLYLLYFDQIGHLLINLFLLI